MLYQLCHDALPQRYPDLRSAVLKQLAHELDVIERAGLAGYFLIVWDIVRFARSRGVRCQGRGSAANSIVAYLLAITSVDPLRHNLLFERFLSADKFTTPDIDVDFAVDRREEVIRYVYTRYGRANTAMVCNVVTYRARSALRDLGKALDFPEAVVERLIGRLESNSPAEAARTVEQLVAESEGALLPAGGASGEGARAESAGAVAPTASVAASVPGTPAAPAAVRDGAGHPLRHLADLLRQIDGCPRHLSIHSGGMLITGPPLDEVVPLEPATMPGRVVVQWDKDSCEDAGLIKIDLLGLGMLGMLSVALGYLEAMGLPEPDLDAIPLDDPAIYRMLQKADTIGTFQVESRAQTQMLPRLKPTRFEDIIIEVAIVRPGPIQGGAVHPYLRRRAGAEPVSYAHPSLEPVLAETLGVLLFQEQAIRVSVASAGFAPGEADMLRRAMSRARSVEAMEAMRERFVEGAARQGIDGATADAIFAQLAGFAGFGFCKSHAASFALIAYQSLWLKKEHPAPFYCALFNQQPMGFYPIEVVAGDARRHGVEVLPPDVNRSMWEYTIERDRRPGKGAWAIRTGLCAVTGLGEAGWARIQAARTEAARSEGARTEAARETSAQAPDPVAASEPVDARPFTDLADFCTRTRLDRDLCVALIRAGACDSLSTPPGERRRLLWQLGEIDPRPTELPLPQSVPVTELPALPALDPLEQTAWEYELLGLSPDGQIMRHYRAALRARHVIGGWEVKQLEQGAVARTAGMMAIRQRPQTANGIVFISLEDESGLLDLVVKPDTWMRLRDVLRGSMLVVVEGTVQRSGRAVSLLVQHAAPLVETLENQPSRKAQRSFFR
jgi:error-prone DNA polymerase